MRSLIQIIKAFLRSKKRIASSPWVFELTLHYPPNQYEKHGILSAYIET